jgi:hypothetical protein
MRRSDGGHGKERRGQNSLHGGSVPLPR